MTDVVQNIDENDVRDLSFPSVDDEYKIYILRQNSIDIKQFDEYLLMKQSRLIQSVSEYFTQQVVNPWEVDLTDKFLETILKFKESTPARIFPMIVREFSEHHFQDLHFPNLSPNINPYFSFENNEFKCVTILTFLSDHDAKGGSVFFPKLATRIYAEKGKSLIIYNTTNKGETIMESMFGISTVIKGQVKMLETSIRLRI